MTDRFPKRMQTFNWKHPDPVWYDKTSINTGILNHLSRLIVFLNKGRNFLRYLQQLQGWKIFPHNIEKNLSFQSITISQVMMDFQL